MLVSLARACMHVPPLSFLSFFLPLLCLLSVPREERAGNWVLVEAARRAHANAFGRIEIPGGDESGINARERTYIRWNRAGIAARAEKRDKRATWTSAAGLRENYSDLADFVVVLSRDSSTEMRLRASTVRSYVKRIIFYL